MWTQTQLFLWENCVKVQWSKAEKGSHLQTQHNTFTGETGRLRHKLQSLLRADFHFILHAWWVNCFEGRSSNEGKAERTELQPSGEETRRRGQKMQPKTGSVFSYHILSYHISPTAHCLLSCIYCTCGDYLSFVLATFCFCSLLLYLRPFVLLCQFEFRLWGINKCILAYLNLLTRYWGALSIGWFYSDWSKSTRCNKITWEASWI